MLLLRTIVFKIKLGIIALNRKKLTINAREIFQKKKKK